LEKPADAPIYPSHQWACPDVDAAYRELKDARLALDPPKVAPYGMKRLYFKDPDGYSICLQWQE